LTIDVIPEKKPPQQIMRTVLPFDVQGAGIAATLDAFLLHQLGYEDIAVYDNAMIDWATDESLPIETG